MQIWTQTEDGLPLEAAPQGTDIVVKANVEFHGALADPVVGLTIEDEDRRPVFAASSIWVEERTGSFQAGDRATLTVKFPNVLAPGRYHITPQIARRGSGFDLADRHPRMISFLVIGTRDSGGIVELDHDLSFERTSSGSRSPGEVSSAVEQIRAAGGTRMRGPSALTGDLRRTLNLTWTLAYLEFRLKFFGSVLGYLWQLGRPLMLFGVYFVVFTQFVRLSEDVKYYPPLLLAGIMLYQFFSETTGGRRAGGAQPREPGAQDPASRAS